MTLCGRMRLADKLIATGWLTSMWRPGWLAGRTVWAWPDFYNPNPPRGVA